ncbi:MAG: ferredoxin--NADP reductase [Polyangiaceae bacterium]|nr:ferredoxin--NADP reductase [Polyangiaceae bacterium]MCW5789818.1 ferredoxin--NADP reductase [Polyangiaceae bacterium]
MSAVTLLERHDWAPGLATFRLSEAATFDAGQFFNLSLPTGDGEDGAKARRSYSAASAPGAPLEFIITEVTDGGLTPGLFQLRPGDTLELDPKPQGFFTLRYVPQARDGWLLATGTGIGPFISLLRAGELWSHFSHVTLVHGVRERSHLAYAEELMALRTARPEQFDYVPCVSREEPPEGGLSGRIPSAITDGRLAARASRELHPDHSQVLLCGNPQMIDDARKALEGLGLRKHRARQPGHVSFEKYW